MCALCECVYACVCVCASIVHYAFKVLEYTWGKISMKYFRIVLLPIMSSWAFNLLKRLLHACDVSAWVPMSHATANQTKPNHVERVALMVRHCVYCYTTKHKIMLQKLFCLQGNTMLFSLEQWTNNPQSTSPHRDNAWKLSIGFVEFEHTVFMFNQLENANINKICNFLEGNYWLEICRVRDISSRCLIFTVFRAYLFLCLF